MEIDQKTIEWLLTGDPCVCWQVQRDLLDKKPAVYQQEQAKITDEGWGKKLLSHQDSEGTWGGGFYSPKWISTTYTLLALRRLGLPSENEAAHQGCNLLLERGFFEPDGGINFSPNYNYSETCITGMILSLLGYFSIPDKRIHRIANHLLVQQMVDGGWNCRSYLGDTHSSFHTTISALEGLLAYQTLYPDKNKKITAARERAHEFLLQHKLYQSHRTGEVVKEQMTRFPFPPRWYYDFLRALDYFQSAGAERDQRFKDAVNLLISKQKNNGLWASYRGPSGRTFFELEPAGKPSRMNTLRALRVLRWWDKGI